jgi:hypothetical protein
MQKLAYTTPTRICENTYRMSWFGRHYHACYCAFCKRPRRVYNKRHVSALDIGLAALFAVVVSAMIWRELSPKGILLFALIIVVGEFTLHWRWRLGLRCGTCGFDPLLYKRNPKMAAAEVRKFYERRRNQPDFLLTNRALLDTQKRIRSAKREQDPYGIKSLSLTPSVGKTLSRTV